MLWDANPDFVAEVFELLLHCQANMAHGQLLHCVFIFVDLFKHQVSALNIAILEF